METVLESGGLSTAHVPMAEAEGRRLLEREFGITGELKRLATEKDDTFAVTCPDGARYVMKVANPSEPIAEVDLQLRLIEHVSRRDPSIPVPRVVGRGDAGEGRCVSVLTYLPGTPLDSTESSADERVRIGEVLARLRLATADFSHPADSRRLAWDVRHASELRPLLEHVGDEDRRRRLAEGMDRIDAMRERVSALRTQVLHNDFSRSNIIVDHDDPRFVTGIIDFGDTVRTAVAVDVSTALLNQLPRAVPDLSVDLFAAGRDLLRGYLSVAELTEEELTLIPHLVMARVVARTLITLRRAELFPDNSTYILRNTDQGWDQLGWFLSRTPKEVAATLLPTRATMNNAFDPSRAESLDPATRGLVERRARLLGPSYRLFYGTPVQLVRAQGVLAWDPDGNEYLDAYNNVVSVGHAHPRVTAAVHEQMQTLCTHTRYLHEGILDYAEDLLATFGGRMSAEGHLMLTCTGTEANELALRIAKYHTGRSGVIITSEAYHGNSELVAGISPSMGAGSPLGVWTRRVPAPDSYRLPTDGLGQWLAGHVALQIEDLERRGEGLAAFIVDSLFSSDGIYADPRELLGPVADVVRRAGGLFIADEVQSGFGRSGERMWGYQRHGIEPDIITMGKPMGNGYPVAGIAVLDEVVSRFGRDMRYFNTFGGNTVAVAAARATLGVIAEEGLVENSDRVGALLREELRKLAARHESIGDVRGSGLYVGIEMVRDRETREPDQAAATAAVNGLRERRVLISATGPGGNVLKIRPPLCFGETHVAHLVEELDQVLSG